MSSVRMRVARRLWCASRRRVSQIMMGLVVIAPYSTSLGLGNMSVGLTMSTRAPSLDSELWVV